jgi:hypothetical protein
MKLVYLIVFGFFINIDVFATEMVKPKKFRHCDLEYYGIESLCNQKTINKCVKEEITNCDTTIGCVMFNLEIDFKDYYNKLSQNFGDFSETQCFRNSPLSANDNGYQIKCEDAEDGTQGLGDYGVSNCLGVLIMPTTGKFAQLPSNKAFLNKKEQQKFCKHLKECSAIVEEVLRKEGKIE